MKTYPLSGTLDLIDIDPPIPGFEEFVGIYVIKGERVALIDVGPQSSAANLLEGLRALDIKPLSISHILLTHIHLDHGGAVGALLPSLPNAQVIVHPKGVAHLIDPEKLWEASLNTLGDTARGYGQPHPVPAQRVIAAEDGLKIDLGLGIELEAIHTPGHAAHHLSFLETGSRKLFVGEACGVYHAPLDLMRPSAPPPLALDQLIASIDRLLKRNPGPIYFSHFGFGGDARTQLIKHKTQLQRWHTVISEGLAKGINDPKALLSELLARDPFLKNINRMPPDQYERERFLMVNGVKGFLGDITRNKS